ncbi:MAG: exosome complex protein Rrp4 [Candidatus Thermoplasmatota archaeon]|nr:exosome complex protein Rrp4 [Candidatus Thermoplasmatota archaeon]
MQQNDSRENVREIVVPGDLLSKSGLKAGPGTYVESGHIYAAQLGIKTTRSDMVGVVPLSGQYIPMRGDMVIGKIVDMGASNWYVDINAAHQSSLHVNEVPWRVEFGETGKFMTVGDLVSLKVVGVDELGKVQISMKEHGLRKLAGGVVIEVAPSKIPRVIGRNGSMIQMLKNATSCRIYVGQNGRIWVDGDLDSMLKAIDAIKLIEAEAHSTGLTEKVEKLLGQKCGKGE